MDQVWFAEHKIRALISGRGMRPSRAIARVLGLSDPEQIKALAALWIDGELAVTIGDDESLFVAGYRDVRSCMQGNGSLCYKAYAPHGTKIAVATVGGAIVARALVRDGAFNTVYGEMSWALAEFLAVFGFDRRPLFDDCAPVVKERTTWEEQRITPGRTVKMWETAESVDRRLSALVAHGHEKIAVEKIGGYRVVILTVPRKITRVLRSENRVVFSPYVDR